jgi:hypothetical protein
MSKLRRNNAKFEFRIHQNINRGPNRITYNPDQAIKFFSKLSKKQINSDTLGVKVKHLDSGLVWETDNPKDLIYFVDNIVFYVGATR